MTDKKKRPDVKVKPDKPDEKTKKEYKFNYEVVVSGEQVNIVAQVMTESQAKLILKHFVENSGLKDIVFSCKRLTPEPFTNFPTVTAANPTFTWDNSGATGGNILFDTSGFPAQ